MNGMSRVAVGVPLVADRMAMAVTMQTVEEEDIHRPMVPAVAA
jgi:hypothetical protein